MESPDKPNTESFNLNRTIIIEVSGGVAWVDHQPFKSGRAIVVDYDNHPDAYVDYENEQIVWGEDPK